MLSTFEAKFPSNLGTVQALFREYAAALDFSLCFQGFDQELASLPGEYAPPGGQVLLALIDGMPAGCVAQRPFGLDACEMKRLYVRPSARGVGAGRLLAERIVAGARQRGYARMLLDTVPQMTAAIALYRSLGFREIPPYRENPIPGALYFELHLAASFTPHG